MHNPESVLESLCDFKIQKKKKKEKKKNKKENLTADYRVKIKESEKKDKYLHLARELKKS